MALLTIAEAREALAIAPASTAITEAALTLELDAAEADIIGVFGPHPSVAADLDADTLAANAMEIDRRKRTQVAVLAARLRREFDVAAAALEAHGLPMVV